jgi:hypothetical protein
MARIIASGLSQIAHSDTPRPEALECSWQAEALAGWVEGSALGSALTPAHDNAS